MISKELMMKTTMLKLVKLAGLNTALIATVTLVSLVGNTAWAAQDHNSTRSNKTANIVSDAGDESDTLLKELSVAGDDSTLYSSATMVARSSVILEKMQEARDELMVGSFINILAENMQKYGCFRLPNPRLQEQCFFNAAKASEKVLKTKHDTVKNSIQNIR